MQPKQSELTYRIIEYGIEKGVVVKQHLIDALQISDIDQQYIDQVLQTNDLGTINPNHIMVRVSTGSSNNVRDYQYRILPTALHNYNEYIELKEARKQAHEAKLASEVSIRIAVAAVLISVILGIAQIFITVSDILLKR